MKASEMFELARAGYKPSEIKEMHELMKVADPEDTEPKDKPKDEPKDKPKDDPEDKPKDEPKDEPKDDPEDKPKDEPDYKAMYEESQRKLEAAQKENRDKNLEKDKPTDMDILAETVKGFM